ncbi:MAG: histidinol-phosphate transaminase [Candidatus Omnitrophica bacterium]|nr:histidinol-phosphate transaminase [Candidatus Omnitrophota bacterium]
MKKDIFKSYIETVKPYEPGKPVKESERELGLRHVVKLASNENPLGPSRKALRAMRKALQEAHYYPESKCFYLVKRLVQELGVTEDQIIIGNGSNEIIELIARGFLKEGDQVLSSATSFLVYPILSQVCGADYVSVPMKDFRYDLRGLLGAVTEKTKVIFIANPNNPTGTYVSTSEVEDFLSKVPKDVLVCFDEAYFDFVDVPDFPHTLFHVKSGKPNVVVMRTFSKSYGLAGLRIGYAVGSPQVIGYLHKIRQPFNVNAIAQAGATAALDDRFFLWRTKHLVRWGRRYLYRRFDQLKLRYLPSQANFILVDCGVDAEEVFQALLRQGIIVRSMKSYGLNTWIRVTIGRRSQNALFYRALKHFLKKRVKVKGV